MSEPSELEEEQEIKPCPCCGSRAELIALTEEPEDSPNFGGEVIACTHCGLASAVGFSIKDSVDEHLLELWNRRIGLADVEARLEAAEREIKEACDYLRANGARGGTLSFLVDDVLDLRGVCMICNARDAGDTFASLKRERDEAQADVRRLSKLIFGDMKERLATAEGEKDG